MKRTKYPKVSTIELGISNFAEGIDASTDENVTDFNKSVNSYNFEFKNGALVEGIGFENLSIPSYNDEGSVEVTAHFQLDQDKSHDFIKLAHFKSFDSLTQKREDRIFAIASDNIPCYTRLITPVPNFTHLRDIYPTECPKISDACLFLEGQGYDIISIKKIDYVRAMSAFQRFTPVLPKYTTA